MLLGFVEGSKIRQPCASVFAAHRVARRSAATTVAPTAPTPSPSVLRGPGGGTNSPKIPRVSPPPRRPKPGRGPHLDVRGPPALAAARAGRRRLDRALPLDRVSSLCPLLPSSCCSPDGRDRTPILCRRRGQAEPAVTRTPVPVPLPSGR